MIWFLIIGILFLVQTEHTAIGVMFIIASIFKLVTSLHNEWRWVKIKNKLKL